MLLMHCPKGHNHLQAISAPRCVTLPSAGICKDCGGSTSASTSASGAASRTAADRTSARARAAKEQVQGPPCLCDRRRRVFDFRIGRSLAFSSDMNATIHKGTNTRQQVIKVGYVFDKYDARPSRPLRALTPWRRISGPSS